MKTAAAGLLALLAGYSFASWVDSLQAGVFVASAFGMFILVMED